MKSINTNWPSIKAFFNTIMYQKYIEKNGKFLHEKGLSEIKASVLDTLERKVLVLTGKDMENKIFYTAISIAENEECTLDVKEKNQLNTKVRKLYHEYRNEDVT